MPAFVMLGKWTDQGMRKITESPDRAKAEHEMFNKAGGKMQLFYTMVKYDFVAILEVPKDEYALAILLCLGSMGSVHDEYEGMESDGAKLMTAKHP